METLTRHLKFAVRKLMRAPLFSVTAATTLAVGIGANTAIFSVVNGILLKPLPFEESDRLVGLWNEAPGLGFDILNTSPALYFTYRADVTSLDGVALWATRSGQITGLDRPEQVESMMVTHEFFPTLRTAPSLGRGFSPEDDLVGAVPTVIITHDYWQQAFGGDPGILGRTLIMNQITQDIIGVLPQGFRFLDNNPEIFFPARFNEAEVAMGNFSYQLFGRLSSKATLEQVKAELDLLTVIAVDRYPGPLTQSMMDQAQFATVTRALKEDVVGDVRSVLWILLGTVGMVLLIACANVANLFLVRAEGGIRDIAVRTALGADRREIARQFLTESVVLGLVGGLGGMALAVGGMRLLVTLGPANLPRLHQVGIDPAVLGFTLCISVLAGLFFGIFPLLRYGRPDLVPALKEGGRGGAAGRDRRRAQSTLVVAQVALALVLLIGSGLMIRSFQALRNVDPGFDNPEEVLTFRVSIPSGLIGGDDATNQAFQQMEEELRGIPGVLAVGTASSIPFGGSESNDPIFIEDAPIPDGGLPPIRSLSWVQPGYFAALGIPLVAGRDIAWDDLHTRNTVAVVSENFARENWQDPASAIGKRIATMNISGGDPLWQEIVGVVGTVYQNGVNQEAPAIIYWPSVQEGLYGEGADLRRTMRFSVRAGPGIMPNLLSQARAAIWNVTPSVPLAQVRTLESLLNRSLATTSFTLIMLGIAASVALLLGAIGIYGVISYTVSLRTKEIGVRMALGARGHDVSSMILRQGLVLAGIGVAIGLVVAAGLARLMESLLFGVTSVDIPTYAAMALALTTVAIVASWVPARRASRLDPADMLRQD